MSDETQAGMPLAARLLGMRERGPGDTLALALAQSRAAEARQARDEAAAAPDPDEAAANLISRGYMPGMTSELARQHDNAVAELETVRAANEKARKDQKRALDMHARGQITVFDIAAMDLAEPDTEEEARLERRAASLAAQLAEAQALFAQQARRPADPLEEVSRHARELLAEVTRTSAPPEPRPFGSRGAAAVRAETVTCAGCTGMGATPEEAAFIHQDLGGHEQLLDA